MCTIWNFNTIPSFFLSRHVRALASVAVLLEAGAIPFLLAHVGPVVQHVCYTRHKMIIVSKSV